MRFSRFSDVPREVPNRVERVDPAREAARIKAEREAELIAQAQAEAAREAKAEAAREAKRLEAERQRQIRTNLAKIDRDFTTRMREESVARDEELRAIEAREGDKRADSLKRLDSVSRKLEDFRAAHTDAVNRATGELGHKLTKEQMIKFGAQVADGQARVRKVETQLRREADAEKGHMLRIPGLANVGYDPIARTIAAKVCRTMAIAAVNHAAPGFGTTVVNLGEMILKACAEPKPADAATTFKIDMPVSVCNGLFEIDIGTTLYDDDSTREPPLDVTFGLNLDGHDTSPHVSLPHVNIVQEGNTQEPADSTDEGNEMEEEEQKRRSRKSDARSQENIESTDADEEIELNDTAADEITTLTTGQHADDTDATTRLPTADLAFPNPTRQGSPSTTTTTDSSEEKAQAAPEATELATYQDADDTDAVTDAPAETPKLPNLRRKRRPATGVLIFGSAKAMASTLQRQALNGSVLASYARTKIFHVTYDGTPASAASAMRMAESLEIVVFLDPGLNSGLWIDVDPVTQALAAVLVIEMKVSRNRIEEFHLVQTEPQRAAHEVSSTTLPGPSPRKIVS